MIVFAQYYETYQEFLKLFEGKLEAVIDKEGSTTREFYEMCKKASRTGGSKWEHDAMFVNLLLATSEYSTFLELMRGEALDLEDEKEAADAEAAKKAVADSESKE